MPDQRPVAPEPKPSVDALLAGLEKRLGPGFSVDVEQIIKQAIPGREPKNPEYCSAPNDTCENGCEPGDFSCSNNHDLACIFCDEGDNCGRKDGACNLAGDIPCGKDDK